MYDLKINYVKLGLLVTIPHLINYGPKGRLVIRLFLCKGEKEGDSLMDLSGSLEKAHYGLKAFEAMKLARLL